MKPEVRALLTKADAALHTFPPNHDVAKKAYTKALECVNFYYYYFLG